MKEKDRMNPAAIDQEAMNLKVTVIVPAYNEVKSIGEILGRVRAQKIENVELEVIVVDDASTDGTREFLEKNPALYDLLLTNPENLGKGGSVKKALARATGGYVLFQDADLEYDPADYAQLLYPVLNFKADVVMGSRFLAPKWVRVSYFWHKIGNLSITFWFNLWNNTTWTDVYSCYLIFRRDLVSPQDLRTTRWQQHAEILGTACNRGRRCFEVPISYNGRTYAEGKKIRWYHVVTVLFTIARVKLFS